MAVINCSSEPGGLRLGAVEAAALQLFGPEKKNPPRGTSWNMDSQK